METKSAYPLNFAHTVFLLGALLLPQYGCQQSPQEGTDIPPQDYCLSESLKKKSEFLTVQQAPVTETLALTGRVAFNPDKMVNFVSLVGGVVVNTYFSLGDQVKKGQLLAEIRSVELSEMQSQRKTLASQLEVAERQLVSVQSMYQDAIASEKDLLEAKSTVNVLKAEIEKTEANFNIFSASADRGVFQIKAPSSGFVVEKNINPGMQISPGAEALFTISGLDEVWVTVNVYAGNVSAVKAGMDVGIKALAYPDEQFSGKIAALSQVFDAEERVMKARVVMKNEDLRLKPGMLVDVQVIKEAGLQAPSVPTKAMIFDDGRNFLLVYHNDCRLEAREVKLLLRSNGTSFLEEGISPGEQIVTRNHLLIYEQIKNFQPELSAAAR